MTRPRPRTARKPSRPRTARKPSRPRTARKPSRPRTARRPSKPRTARKPRAPAPAHPVRIWSVSAFVIPVGNAGDRMDDCRAKAAYQPVARFYSRQAARGYARRLLDAAVLAHRYRSRAADMQSSSITDAERISWREGLHAAESAMLALLPDNALDIVADADHPARIFTVDANLTGVVNVAAYTEVVPQ